jgi:prepilin-type N-terminal cleavage/methylation domain-containing protein
MTRGKVHDIIKRARERGMTLVEMMVALLISSLVIFGVVTVYRFAYNNWTDGMMVERLQSETQSAMNDLEKDVKQAVVTTNQEPMITTDNGNPVTTGYGVIIIDNIGTSGLATYEQVDYRLTSGGQLQRFDVGTYGGIINPLFPLNKLTTLLTSVSCASAPFTVTTQDPVTLTTLIHPSLTIATLTVQQPNVVRTTNMSGAVIHLITTLTMGGNVLIQEGQ